MRSLLLAAALLASTAAHGATVVTADRYLDVNSGKYVEHPAIFIGDDGRITNIADARTVRWGADVEHVDLSGKTLVPGLIDMHVHLDSPADIGGYRGFEYTDSFWQAASPRSATSAHPIATMSASSRRSRTAMRSARGSFRPAMR